MEIRSNLKYTKEHEWVAVDGDVLTLGITDFAQDKLGDIVYIELPEVGTLSEDVSENIGSIESVKAVSDFYCPIEGEVVEVNKDLEEKPELTNSSPYDDGWIIKIKIDPAALSQADLMDDEEYTQFIQ